MSNPYEGKDGLARDIAKLKYNWDTYVKAPMSVAWDEFLEAIPNPIQMSHKYTNLHVEFCRADAYVAGHFYTVFFYLNTIAWIGVGIACVV